VPVIDFGDDLCWLANGIPAYRLGREKLTTEPAGPNAFRIGYPFSLEVPLNPQTSIYNERGNNTRFYGGMLTQAFNTPDARHHWTEGGINVDHEGYDDFNYMGFALKSRENRQQAVGVWLWQKADFLNGGDRHPVRFADTSRVAVYLSRTYAVDKFTDTYANTRIPEVPRELWKGWESVHLIVRDGEQFYISERSFAPIQRTLCEIRPTTTNWTPWTSTAPWGFTFDPATATFAPHTFTDVTAVGWMINKTQPTIAGLWLKWYAFGMDAVVDRPWQAGHLLPMRRVGGGEARDGLWQAEAPLSDAHWRRIHRWAFRNQYALHPGYDFLSDGDPGPDGRVTDLAWHDAVLWCNALSEYEGRTPCYYLDAACTQVARWAIERNQPDPGAPRPVHLKADADGYRLPVAGEIDHTGSPLWEYTWDGAGDGRHLLVGGPDLPSPSAGNIGFRPVRREGPATTIPLPATASAGVRWHDPGAHLPDPAIPPKLDTVAVAGLVAGRTEITWAQWLPVRRWAESAGWRFDNTGDCGSRGWDLDAATHADTEPVTRISIIDALVWCNALSTMQGLRPCYYADDAHREVLNRSPTARALALRDRSTVYELKIVGLLARTVRIDPQADGWRLPMNDEWTALAGDARYPCGDELDPATAWFADTSGGTTHPVATRTPLANGLCDLSGNVWEWALGLREAKTGRNEPAGTVLYECARGGSFRTEHRRNESFLATKFLATNLSFGGGMNPGIAKPEIGFRVVRSSR
jgi:formylglycine-generating enzyme required for sulfatase activity